MSLESVPWALCVLAVLAVLAMVVADGCRRRSRAGAPRLQRKRAQAAQTRRAVRKATRGKLEALAAALDSDKPEKSLARLAAEAEEGRQ